ncbi:MAG: type IIL restriction-modification enzyme MmeI, partial [Bacteroidota bacterium]
KWFIFLPGKLEWLPADSTNIIASDDYYILGIATSAAHRRWIEAQSSTLKGDTRYTPSTCFNTFPFPQAPSSAIVQTIRAKSIELHEYRSAQMEEKQWGITRLYNEYFNEPASQLCQLHKELDSFAMEAYGFEAGDDILERLLDLNLELADKEQRGETVVGPWDPTAENQPEAS